METLTVNLENLTVEERVTLTRLMTKANTPPQWQPEGGRWCVSISGAVVTAYRSKGISEFGSAHSTQIKAEKARDAMRIHNRLLAYVAEFDTTGNDVCSIAILNGGKYDYAFRTPGKRTLGTVYMSEPCARELAEKLNSGEVTL